MLSSLNKKLYQVTDFLTWVLGVTMCLLVGFQILNRFMLHISAPWSEEFCRYNFIWLAIVGSAKATHDCEHLSMDLLTILIKSESIKKFFNLIVNIVILFFFAIMTYQSAVFTWSNAARNAITINIPMICVYIILPLGFGAMFLFELQHALRNLISIFSKDLKEEVVS